MDERLELNSGVYSARAQSLGSAVHSSFFFFFSGLKIETYGRLFNNHDYALNRESMARAASRRTFYSWPNYIQVRQLYFAHLTFSCLSLHQFQRTELTARSAPSGYIHREVRNAIGRGKCVLDDLSWPICTRSPRPLYIPRE